MRWKPVRSRALAAGFDEHLVKPTTFDGLKRLIADGRSNGAHAVS